MLLMIFHVLNIFQLQHISCFGHNLKLAISKTLSRVGWYTGIIILAGILATTVQYVEILFSYGVKK